MSSNTQMQVVFLDQHKFSTLVLRKGQSVIIREKITSVKMPTKYDQALCANFLLIMLFFMLHSTCAWGLYVMMYM